jgi:hypothetical protein
MNLVAFTIDSRPHRGYQTIYINPAEVSSVMPSESTDNPTRITMNNGKEYHVKGYTDEAALKLKDGK